MEKSSKRGKIPQSDWPLIMARYEAGETLASIARTYDCSPPAISYIVGRSRNKPVSETPPAAIEPPQLVKAAAAELVVEPVAEAAAPRPAPAPVPVAIRREPPPARPDETRPREANGVSHRNGVAERETNPSSAGAHPAPRPAAAAAPAPSEPRRTLHLSLGNGGNGGQAHHGNGQVVAGNGAGNGHAHEALASPERGRQPLYPPSTPAAHPTAPQRNPAPVDQGSYGRHFAEMVESGRSAQLPRGETEAPRRKEVGSFIDQELRTRVDGDIAAFLAAFDAALAADTPESRFGLREATDRLLRAGARTRIELERLEARVPLAPR